jgi:hypothetical protein
MKVNLDAQVMSSGVAATFNALITTPSSSFIHIP